MTLLPYDVTVALPVLTMAVALPSSSDAERMRRLGAVTEVAKLPLLSNTVRSTTAVFAAPLAPWTPRPPPFW